VQRWGSRLACAACAALLAAGCGDSGSSSGSPTPPAAADARTTDATSTTTGALSAAERHALDDRRRAQLALLPRADVPDRVAEQNPARNHSICSPRALFRRLATGVATTPRYTTSEAEVQQSVLLFRDAATARRAFRALDSSANRHCIVGSVRAEAVARVGQPVAGLTRQILTVQPVGQQSTSYRLLIPIPRNEAAFEVLADRIGRALSSVSLLWQVPTSDLAFQDELATRIGARVRYALG
jgi:hypothetical protein